MSTVFKLNCDHTFHGVASSVKRDLCRSQASAAPVIVNIGQLEVPELAEQLVDVGVRHAEVQVGDDELARGGDASGPHAAAAGPGSAPAAVQVMVPLTVRISPGVTVSA